MAVVLTAVLPRGVDILLHSMLICLALASSLRMFTKLFHATWYEVVKDCRIIEDEPIYRL